MTDIQQLNEYQQAAVLDESDACVVNANVGSGKTTVLISKILYLHEKKQIPYNKMVVLTFTNKAAGEIIERLNNKEQGLKKEDVPYFGTFHSVALYLLKNILPVEQLGYTKDFSIIRPEEEADLAMQIVTEHGLTIKYKNRLMKRLEEVKNKQKLERQQQKYKDDIVTLIPMLENEKKIQDKMTFYDLIANSILLLKEHPIHPSFIIIDEVQDSDDLQLAFVKSLKEPETKLFAVGDPNQVIYSWRGSRLNVFYDLKHQFDAKELTLPVNYRCTDAILKVAKCFLENGNAIKGSRDQGEKIVVSNHYNPFMEAEYLSDKIKKLHEYGTPYSQIAVFYRMQQQSGLLREVFARNGIPNQVSLSKTIKDIPVLMWFLDLLKGSLHRNDKASAIKVLMDSQFGEGYTMKKAVKVLNGEQKKPLPVLEKMQGFLAIDWEKQKDCFAHAVYEYFELDTMLHPTSSDFAESKEAVTSFLAIMESYIKECGAAVLEGSKDFLNRSALYGINILQKDIIATEDSVKLMTLHASKGLEFDNVFIIGVNNGLIPIQSKGFEEEEEERRLFFVGITRAKDHLEFSYYTNPEGMRIGPRESRYLKVIPKDLLDRGEEERKEPEGKTGEDTLQNLRKQVMERIRNNSGNESVESLFGIKMQEDESWSESEDRKEEIKAEVLLTVRHAKYGMGTVIAEDEMMVTVNFESYGEKQFMKAFSELEYI